MILSIWLQNLKLVQFICIANNLFSFPPKMVEIHILINHHQHQLNIFFSLSKCFTENFTCWPFTNVSDIFQNLLLSLRVFLFVNYFTCCFDDTESWIYVKKFNKLISYIGKIEKVVFVRSNLLFHLSLFLSLSPSLSRSLPLFQLAVLFS